MSELLPHHVLDRFWVLVFWTRIGNFSLTECISTFCHFALVICTVFRFNKPPWFVVLLWPFHGFHSWHIIFHIQNLLSCIRSVQKWRLVAVFNSEKFLSFSFLWFIICLACMDYFVVNSKFQTENTLSKAFGVWTLIQNLGDFVCSIWSIGFPSSSYSFDLLIR